MQNPTSLRTSSAQENVVPPIQIPSLCTSVDRKGSLLKAITYLQRTLVHGSDNMHRACVCVACDSFIIGTERIQYLSSQQLWNKSSYLSVSYSENMSGKTIPALLREQYKIQDNEKLQSLLLSPRAPTIVDEQSTECLFMTCHTCYSNITNKKTNKPPRFAISNGWAIGYIPSTVIDNIEDILAAMVNKIRLFSYVFSYSGGSHKSIKGHHTFFMNDPEKIGSTLHKLKKQGSLNDVYAMACGRLTPNQRQIVQDRCKISTTKYITLINFLIQNHPGYTDVLPPMSSPEPTLIGIEQTSNNTDESNGENNEEETNIDTI